MFYGTHPWVHNGRSGTLHHDGSATHWTHKSQLGSHSTIPNRTYSRKVEADSYSMPLDWPSNYSLLRLWHTTKASTSMLHNSSSKCSIVICLLTGKSTARSWRAGCSSSARPIMCQKRCLGNMCKNGFSPIGDYVGKRKRLTGLPFRPNAMNCGFLPQRKRELTLSPL